MNRVGHMSSLLSRRRRKRPRPWSSFAVVLLCFSVCESKQDPIETDVSPVPTPVVVPTESPVPSPSPSAGPTPRPSDSFRPTLTPTAPPTDTSAPSPSPSFFPTDQPTRTTMSPTTTFPTWSPTAYPTTNQPTTETPTMVPSLATLFPSSEPTNPLETLFPTTMPSLVTLFPSAEPTITVPLSPLDMTITFDSPVIGEVTTELELVVADYLLQGLQDEDFVGGYQPTFFDLNVTQQLMTRNRMLQETTRSYTVEGDAQFTSTESIMASPDLLSPALDVSVASLFNDAEEFTRFLQNHPSSQLLQSVSDASVGTFHSALEDPEETRRPGVVEIVFGFLLVVLALVSLVFYAYVWLRRIRKRRAQRKRERETVYANPSGGSSHGRHAVPGFLATTTTSRSGEDSSDDASSENGVSESTPEVENDAFAKELKLAASLDRRAWEEFQQRRRQMEEQGMMVGNKSPKAENDVDAVITGVSLYGVEEEGFEVRDIGNTLMIEPADDSSSNVTPDTMLGPLSTTTFPYGDENLDESDTPNERNRIPQVPSDVEAPETKSSFESASSSARPEPLQTIEGGLRTSPLSIPSFQGSPASSVQGGLRTSPSASATTILAGNRQPPIHDEESGTTTQDSTEDKPKESESFLPFDIVKEVQKLSQFVKSYEKKKEREKERELRKRSGSDSASDRSPYMLDDPSETDSSQQSLSSGSQSQPSPVDPTYLPAGLTIGSIMPELEELDGPSDSDSSVFSDESEKEADDSRLGITPFHVQRSEEPKFSVLESSRPPRIQVSKPPVTGAHFGSTPLSPIPGTPRTPQSASSFSPSPRLETPESKFTFDGPRKEDTVALSFRAGSVSPLKPLERASIASPLEAVRPPDRDLVSPQAMGPRQADRVQSPVPTPPSDRELVSPRVVGPRSTAPPTKKTRGSKSLQSLRTRDAVLDGVNDAAPAVAAAHDTPEAMRVGDSPSRRSKNPAFNTLLSMFESKPKAAIFPPNESWQYNS